MNRKKGDRVRLRKDSTFYDQCPDVIGRVDRHPENNAEWIHVTFEHGYSNFYRDMDLVLICDGTLDDVVSDVVHKLLSGLIVLCVVLIPTIGESGVKYNNMEDTWENTSDDAGLRYDNQNDKWSFVPGANAIRQWNKRVKVYKEPLVIYPLEDDDE